MIGRGLYCRSYRLAGQAGRGKWLAVGRPWVGTNAIHARSGIVARSSAESCRRIDGWGGQRLDDVREGAVTGVRAALTTHPATAARNAARGLTSIVDTAIAAEGARARAYR